MKRLVGIVGSCGYSHGAAVVKTGGVPVIPERRIDDPAAEIARFREAQATYAALLEQLGRRAERELGTEIAEIFSAYGVIVHDEAFFSESFRRVERELRNIESIIDEDRRTVMRVFAAIDDPYMRERAADVENVCNALILIMTGQTEDFAAQIDGRGDVVAVADVLTPAETVSIDRSSLRGIATEKGSITSHTVILAKALGVPAVVGVRGLLDSVADGDEMLIDAFTGRIVVAPNDIERSAFLATWQ